MDEVTEVTDVEKYMPWVQSSSMMIYRNPFLQPFPDGKMIYTGGALVLEVSKIKSSPHTYRAIFGHNHPSNRRCFSQIVAKSQQHESPAIPALRQESLAIHHFAESAVNWTP